MLVLRLAVNVRCLFCCVQMKEAAQDALEGFGIVTLASLLPVLAVSILSISLTFIYTHEDIMA